MTSETIFSSISSSSSRALHVYMEAMHLKTLVFENLPALKHP